MDSWYCSSLRLVICAYSFSILLILEISMRAMCFCRLIFYSFRLLFIALLLTTFSFYFIAGNFSAGFLPRNYFILYLFRNCDSL